MGPSVERLAAALPAALAAALAAGLPAALAAAMERFCADPALAARMGAVARRVATERYAVERVNRLLLDTMELSAVRSVAAPAAEPIVAEVAA